MTALSIPPARPYLSRPAFEIPSAVASDESRTIQEAAARVAALVTGLFPRPAHGVSLEEKLYNARSAAKRITASVAMHLDQEWREALFKQLDLLLDADEWDEADQPATEGSFVTFIRMLLMIKARRRPGLGASADGHYMRLGQ